MNDNRLTPWQAAHQAARRLLNGTVPDQREYLSLGPIWREISTQLRLHPDRVDLEAVRPQWATESLQRQLIRQILREAGFRENGACYQWPESTRSDH